MNLVEDHVALADAKLPSQFQFEPVLPPVSIFNIEADKLSVAFTDASYDALAGIVEWRWEFGDGTESTARHPTHVYALPGSYTVTLTVTNDRDVSATTDERITVVANIPPTAAFEWSNDNLDVTFVDASVDQDGSIESYFWDFGDGSTSSEQSPSHTYAANGTYNVTLLVVDSNGATAQETKAVALVARSTIVDRTVLQMADSVDRTTYTTSSISPGPTELMLLWVVSSATTPAAPTVTGAGLTWVQVDTVTYATSARRMTLFRALGIGATPGTLSIDFAGVTQTGCVAIVQGYTGVNQSGANGSGAIVGAAVNVAGSSVTTLTATLPAFEHANNVHACCAVANSQTDVVADVDFTSLGTATIPGASAVFTAQAQSGVNQPACTSTWATAAFCAAISVEVKSGVS